MKKKKGKEKETLYTHPFMKEKKKKKKETFAKNRTVINMNFFF